MRRLSTKESSLPLALSLTTALFAAACSRAPATSQAKISNGTPVDIADDGAERVSTAGLKAFTATGSYTCSAAIIGTDRLVTAAHCVAPGAKIYAYFGRDMLHAAPSEFTAVAKAIVQPDFDANSAAGVLPANDVALLRLEAPIPGGYQPVPVLPDEAQLSTDRPVVLAGFGITEQSNDAGFLRYTATTYIGPDQEGRLQVNDARRRGACSGDSGGPLFGTIAGTTYVAGVLSGGPVPCRGINFYTSLARQKTFLAAANAALNDSALAD